MFNEGSYEKSGIVYAESDVPRYRRFAATVPRGESVTAQMNIRWLSEPGSEPMLIKAGRKEPRRTELPFRQGEGHGWVEMLDLPFGIHLCRVVHHFEPGEAAGLRPVSEVVTEFSEPVLFVQTARQGRGYCMTAGWMSGWHTIPARASFSTWTASITSTGRIRRRQWRWG